MLTSADKGKRGVVDSLFLADTVCEKPLNVMYYPNGTCEGSKKKRTNLPPRKISKASCGFFNMNIKPK